MRVICVIKKLLSFILSGIIMLSACILSSAGNGLSVSAKGAVLMCAHTGEVLFSLNEHEHLPMASTTKIMTALLAIEACTPGLEIVTTDEMVSVEGTSMGLLPGDTVTLINLVYGMLLESGNDAANTVALVLGGSQEGFAQMMNERARQIGMNDTNFVTASGLDAKEHYSSAYDMGLLACRAIANPEFRRICSLKSARVSYGNPPYMRTLTNHNRLLRSYKDAIGIKTGFTKKSGRCLVSAAQRDGVVLVAVTLNASDDWNDHIRMFEYGFSKVKKVPLDTDLSGITLEVAGAGGASAALKVAGEPFAAFAGEVPSIEREVRLRTFEYAPLKRGDVVGSVSYYADGELLCEAAVVADEDVNAYIPSPPAVKEESKVNGLLTRIINRIKNFVLR